MHDSPDRLERENAILREENRELEKLVQHWRDAAVKLDEALELKASSLDSADRAIDDLQQVVTEMARQG